MYFRFFVLLRAESKGLRKSLVCILYILLPALALRPPLSALRSLALRSPLIAQYSSLTAHHSPLTSHRSSLTALCASPSALCSPPFALCPPPFALRPPPLRHCAIAPLLITPHLHFHLLKPELFLMKDMFFVVSFIFPD